MDLPLGVPRDRVATGIGHRAQVDAAWATDLDAGRGAAGDARAADEEARRIPDVDPVTPGAADHAVHDADRSEVADGDALVAAEKLGRSWIGIDVTHLAISLIQGRLKRDFDLESRKDYDLEGTPKDVEAARFLFNQGADGPYQFQFWVIGLIGAQAHGAGASGKGKKGGDTGIDGKVFFRTPGGERLETVIISVKGGASLNPGMIRDLRGVVEREKAAMGVFISLEAPTQGMYTEAATSGFYEYDTHTKYPRIQILTVEDLLNGRRPQVPAGSANVSLEPKKAKSARTDQRGKSMTGLFDAAG